MLANMDQNVPMIVKTRNTCHTYHRPIARHDGSIALCLKYLMDSEYARYDLCPLPNMNTLDFPDLLREICDWRLPAEKAAWFVHHFVTAVNLRGDKVMDAVTEALSRMGDTYFVRTCEKIYRTNVLDHVPFLRFVIEKAKPKSILPFADEIVATHALMIEVLESPKAEELVDVLREKLLLNRSQLVQLGARCVMNEKMCYEDHVMKLLDPQVKERVRMLIEYSMPIELRPNVVLRDCVFKDYPKYDLDDIANEINVFKRMLEPETYRKWAIGLCECVLVLEEDVWNIAPVVAHVMKQTDIIVTINEFMAWTLDNIEHVARIGLLFGELQYHNILRYEDMLNVFRARGIVKTRRKDAADILKLFPCIDCSRNNIMTCNRLLYACDPECETESILRRLLVDPLGRLDLAVNLPYSIRFQIAGYLTRNAEFSTSEIEDALCQLGVYSLLPATCKKRIGGKNLQILFRAHKCRSEHACQVEKEIVGSSVEITKRNVIDLMKRYSYLCSLEVYDEFFGIRDASHFGEVFEKFLADVLRFAKNNYAIMEPFRTEFCASNCIQDPSYFFLSSFVMLYMLKPTELEVQVLVKLFEDDIAAGRHIPRDFIISAFAGKKKCHEVTEQSLADVLRLIFECIKASETVAVATYLDGTIIAMFTECFGAESHIFTEYLSVLRNKSPPLVQRNIDNDVLVALFSLLPEDLLSENVDTVFAYFQRCVTDQVAVFWSLWLRSRSSFRPGFPVVRADMGDPSAYRVRLVYAFRGIMNIAHPVFGRCWSILCEDPAIADIAFEHASADLLFLRPVLRYANEAAFTRLWLNTIDACDDGVVVLTSSLIAFVRRFGSSVLAVVKAVEHLLFCMRTLYENESPNIVTIIDTVNFVVCQPHYADFFSSELRTRICDSIVHLPVEIRKHILLNLPPQMFIPSREPLLSNVRERERQAPAEPAPTFDNSLSFLEDMGDMEWNWN